MSDQSPDELFASARACTLCAEHLPLGPRPVFQADPRARILIAGQAPGRRVHATGVPFDDPSGDRLRDWLGIDRAVFYDATRVAILPMGFCYPGTGKSGDLPPRPECAATWREAFLAHLPRVELTLVLGQYALDYHLDAGRVALTEVVRDWRRHWPARLPLPHPSPRNNRWLVRNPWFAEEVLPALRARVADVLAA
ncbi:uracil-DNA glycosylase family protein [Nitrogeniibacter mangrovi]|uniref:Uracil-DNA glycosylase family protein n=1 Tax=Nitrogeniibacter mangrovi TaxID=2016596 RepID=A0A6C1AYW8_9RHOO|nr:uracil-DNA glycosylase family protein [Nitrogeniibacter mangrovi]QID16333.1 uracil-DNA glycosylase family protein [Nitrogeniibacter mangrovi]